MYKGVAESVFSTTFLYVVESLVLATHLIVDASWCAISDVFCNEVAERVAKAFSNVFWLFATIFMRRWKSTIDMRTGVVLSPTRSNTSINIGFCWE